MSRQAKLMVALVVAGLCVGVASVSRRADEGQVAAGAQSYSFNRFTFEEAMAKTKACGMKYIEVFPDQKIGKEFGDTVFKNMTPAQRQQLKQMLKDSGLTLTCYGVITPGQRAGVAQGVRLRQGHGLRDDRVGAAGERPADDRQAVQGVQDRRGDSQPSEALPLLEL